MPEPTVEIWCPRPGLTETKDEVSSVSDRQRFDVESALSERLWLGLRERTVETDDLAPGEE